MLLEYGQCISTKRFLVIFPPFFVAREKLYNINITFDIEKSLLFLLTLYNSNYTAFDCIPEYTRLSTRMKKLNNDNCIYFIMEIVFNQY